jgi:peptidoglycan-associated lipoprotein
MNPVSKKFCLSLLAGGALLLAGCPKTPPRPDPSITNLGQGVGPTPMRTNDSFRPEGVSTIDPNSQLQNRDPFSAIDDGNTIRFQFGANSQVFFDYDRSDVKQSERAKFPAVKEYLEKNPGTRVLMEGHCDWRGTAEYNLALGERRAGAAKRYLLSLGVKADRIETTSKGSLDASKNADDATAAKDRRVDIVIIKAQPTGAAAAAKTTL